MARIVIHGMMFSPAVRSVCLTCEALNIPYELKVVNLAAREHLTPEYMKMNPLHTIPTIQDGEFCLFESHAIVAYLADKYGEEKWYPKDLQKRATVNTRLHFSNAILFTRTQEVVTPVLFFGRPAYDLEKLKRLEDALVSLEKLIGDNLWVAGNTPTIADFCCASTVSSMVAVLPSSPVPPTVQAWLKRCEQTFPKYEEIHNKMEEDFEAILKIKMSSFEALYRPTM